ncbi:MAG: DUF4214 domain-containing protein [Candidatus Binataceae bacterium]
MSNLNSESVKLKDLLRHHDDEFVVNAYRCILGREPDQPGLEGHLSSLRSAKATKLEIVANIRFSPEGRRKRARIKGLFMPLSWHLLGHVPRYASRFVRGRNNSTSPPASQPSQTHDAAPPAFHPTQTPDSVVDQNLTAILEKLSEFASAIQMLKGLADGLREIRRSESALRKDLQTLDAKVSELQTRNLQTQTIVEELCRRLAELDRCKDQ